MPRKKDESTVKIINELDVDQLKGIIKALGANSSLGVTVAKAKSIWKGGFMVRTEAKDFMISSDEPCALGGKNEAPNPMAILLGAFGACFCISYVLIASVRGVAVDRLELELEGDVDMPLFMALCEPKVSDAKPGFNEIRAKLYVKSKAPMDELEKIHSLASEYSPVGQTIARQVKIISKFSKRRLS